MSKLFLIFIIGFLFKVTIFAGEINLTHSIDVNAEVEEMFSEDILQMKKSFEQEIKQNITKNNLKNNQFKDWINPTKVTKISYLLATGKGLGRSSFGHSYLRISYKDDLSIADDTIEFVADATEEELSNLKGYLKGIGLNGKYGIKIAKAKYSKVKDYHTMTENRDLVSYVLDIDDQQKIKIIEKLNELLVIGTNQKYAFFTSNCADVVTDVINTGLNKKISGVKSVIPSAIPSQLEKLKLVKDIYTDDKKSIQREKAVEKKYPKFLEISDSILAVNLKKQLQSKSLKERVTGFYKLQLLRESMSLRDSIRVTSLVNAMIPFESRVAKYQLTQLFSTRSVKVEEFSKIRFELKNKRKAKVVHKKLRVKGNKVYLNVVIRQGGERKRLRFHLNELKHDQGVITDKNGKVISLNFGKELIKGHFFHPSLYMHVETVKFDKKQYLVSVLVSEKENFRDNFLPEIDREDEIAYKQGEFKNIGLGMCFAHSELSQKLEMSAIYLPEKKKLSEHENLRLVSDLYSGKIIIIPGHKNGNEFTASLNKDELGKIIYKRQQQKYSVTRAYLDYFDETSIKTENFYIIKNLLSLGINPIISFRTNRNIGHSVLVSKIYDRGDHYSLTIIDPNMTYQENVYKFNKGTSELDTVFYGVVKMRLPYFDMHEYLTKIQILNMKKTRQTAIQSAEKLRQYSIWPTSFFYY